MNDHNLNNIMKLIILFIIVFVTSLKSQMPDSSFIKLDSLLYVNHSLELPFRYKDYLDSIQQTRSNLLENWNKDSTVIFTPIQKPRLFGIDVSGNVISLEDYLDEVLQDFPPQLFCAVKIKIDWLGNIRNVRLIGYKGKGLNEVDFEKIFANLKAIPLSYNDIPQNSHMSLPLKRK